MHIQLPKPLHGWREFAGEVGVIVLGVLIALCAQQMLSDWQWRSDVRDADQRMTAELIPPSLLAGVPPRKRGSKYRASSLQNEKNASMQSVEFRPASERNMRR